MTLEKIRQKTQELHAKTRRAAAESWLCRWRIGPRFGYGIDRFADLGAASAFAFAIAWSLAGQYFLNRGMWSAMLPGDAA